MSAIFRWVRQKMDNDTIVGGLLFAIVIAVYGTTMCRTIYTGDDGDFITAMQTLGTPHPTGYPLFCLLGHLTLRILAPIVREPAARINLLTIFFGALATPTFFRFLRVLKIELSLAISGTLLFAFAPTLWQQCLSCEVYALTAFYLALLLLKTTQWLGDTKNDSRLCQMAFLYGLAATNHLTIVLFFPGFLILVFGTRPDLLPWRNLRVFLALVGLFLLPLSLYLYLPITARLGYAPVEWGNPSTPFAFWQHLTGAQYQDMMISNAPKLLTHFKAYLGYLWNEYNVILLCFALVGIVALWQKKRSLCLLLLYIYAVNLGFNINYGIADIYVYYIPSYMIIAVFFTVGASSIFQWILTRLRLSSEKQVRYRRLVAPVLCIIPIVHMSLHYAETDKSGNYLEHDISANILASSPPHSVVLLTNIIAFSMWYHRFVLEERPDVVPIDVLMVPGMLEGNNWYYNHIHRMYPQIGHVYPSGTVTDTQLQNSDFILTMIRRGLERGEPMLVVTDDPRFYAIVDKKFDRVPWGITERLYLKGKAPSPSVVVTENARIWKRYQLRGLYTGWAHNDEMQERIPLRYANAGVRFGVWAEKVKRWDIADAAYSQASKLYHIPAADAGRARCARALRDQIATR